MTDDRGSGDYPSSSILDQLEFMEEFVGETIKKGVTIVEAGGDEGVNQDCSTIGSE